jgi:hypothetical protein
VARQWKRQLKPCNSHSRAVARPKRSGEVWQNEILEKLILRKFPIKNSDAECAGAHKLSLLQSFKEETVGGTTISLAILLAATALSPPETVVADYVDVIEINHFYDEQGKLVFDQVLYFDWSPSQSRYNVRAWRLLKSPAQVPQKDGQRGDYVATFFDGDALRTVRAASFRETWTQHDPELAEREYLPKEHRRELRSLSGQRKAARHLVAAQ